MKKTFAVMILALVIMAGAQAAQAESIQLALVLDASSSISDSQWALQIQGYASALGAVLPTDGSVAVSVTRFGETASIVRSMQIVNNAADLAALQAFFLGLPQSGNGDFTCISCGIFLGESTFTGTATLRSVLDVSTDGEWNRGVDPALGSGTVGTALWAVTDPRRADAVNVLGIGPSAVTGWHAGTDSFSITAAGFDDFESTLTAKLERELILFPNRHRCSS